MKKYKKRTTKALKVAEVMYKALTGLRPDVQGAILVELVSTYFAGHPPAIRHEIITHFMGAVQEMIPLQDAWASQDQPKPPDWDMN